MAKIKITGDTSEIKKSLMDLSKDVKEIGKSKVAIFDKEQRDFLTKEAHNHMSKLQSEIKANQKEIALNVKLQNKQGRSLKEQVRTRERLTKLLQQQVKLQKESHQLGQAQTQIAGATQGAGGGGIMGKLKGLGGKGGMLGRLGLGAGALRMLGPLGLAAGAGMFAYGRGKQAVNTFSGGVQDRIALRGRGVGDMNLEDPERAARAGMSAQDVRKGRLTAMDVFGRGGATQSAVLQRAEVERNFGIEQGTMTGIGGQLRGQMGGEGANKAVMTIQASLIASGITDEIGPYLETTAQMLSSLNENGFTFNDSALAVLNNLAANGVASERGGRMIMGVDQAIRKSTGEQNAVFQQIFKGAGIGGQSVGGIQAAIRSGGLFGANLDAPGQMLSGTDKKAFKEIGIGGRTGTKVARSAVNLLDTMFGNDDDINKLLASKDKNKRQAGATRRLQRNNFIMNTFGLDNEVQGAEVNKMLQDMANPEIGARKKTEIEKKLKDMQAGNTELGNLKLITKSTAGNWDETKKLHETIKDEFGAKLAPAFLTMDKTMMKLDTALSAMIDFFGIETPDDKAKEALTGSDVLDKETLDQITMGDPKRQDEFSKKLADSFVEKQSRLEELQSSGKGYTKEALDLRQQLRNLEESDTSNNLGAGKNMSKKDRAKLDAETVKRFKQEEFSAKIDPIVGMMDAIDSIKGWFSSDDKKPATQKPKESDNNKSLEAIATGINKSVRVQERNERNTRKVGTIPAKTGKTN